MPSQRARKRPRTAADDGAVDFDAWTVQDGPPVPPPKRTRAAPRQVEEGASSSTFVDLSPSTREHGVASRRHSEKGKGKAAEPADPRDLFNGTTPVGLTDAEQVAAQHAVLGRLARSLTCSICMNIYDNPVSLACGHVFCRACLERCFSREVVARPETDSGQSDISDTSPTASDVVSQARTYQRDTEAVAGGSSPLRRPYHLSADQRRRNLVCPVCRARVHDAPTPIFAFRETADIMRRAEADGLLPLEEDRGSKSPPPCYGAESSKRAQQDADTTWGGLFLQNSSFSKRSKDVMARGVNDRDDGVFRCWRCNWEIEEGVCNHWCGSIALEELPPLIGWRSGEVYEDMEHATHDSDEESHFSNLPLDNGLGNSASSSSTSTDEGSESESEAFSDALHDLATHRRARRSERVDSDVDSRDHAGDGQWDEEDANSEDRAFLATSEDEPSIHSSMDEPTFGDAATSSPPPPHGASPSRRRRVITVDESDDEVPATTNHEQSSPEPTQGRTQRSIARRRCRVARSSRHQRSPPPAGAGSADEEAPPSHLLRRRGPIIIEGSSSP